MDKKIFIIPLILISSVFCIAFISAFSGSGTGTLADPYQITNCTQLQEIEDDLSGNYILVNDINCSDTINWNSGDGFSPVNVFIGTLDGQDYTINDLYINRPIENGVGLFGSIGVFETSSGNISNVNLENVNITGSNDVASLVGYFDGGIIDNCSSSGNIECASYCGGLIGEISQQLVLINNSHSSNNVNGLDTLGGLTGTNYGRIDNSYATGNVTGTDASVGGLSGDNYAVITNSYATGNIYSTGNQVGGLVGWQFTQGYDIYINNSYATGNVIGFNNVGGYFNCNNLQSNAWREYGTTISIRRVLIGSIK
jgi:hypothetical protein